MLLFLIDQNSSLARREPGHMGTGFVTDALDGFLAALSRQDFRCTLLHVVRSLDGRPLLRRLVVAYYFEKREPLNGRRRVILLVELAIG